MPCNEDGTELVVKLTPEEIRALWLAYKGPVGDNAAEHLGTAGEKLYDVLKAYETIQAALPGEQNTMHDDRSTA